MTYGTRKVALQIGLAAALLTVLSGCAGAPVPGLVTTSGVATSTSPVWTTAHVRPAFLIVEAAGSETALASATIRLCAVPADECSVADTLIVEARHEAVDPNASSESTTASDWRGWNLKLTAKVSAARLELRNSQGNILVSTFVTPEWRDVDSSDHGVTVARVQVHVPEGAQ